MLYRVKERARSIADDAVSLRPLQLSQAVHDSPAPRRTATLTRDSRAAVNASGSTARASWPERSAKVRADSGSRGPWGSVVARAGGRVYVADMPSRLP